MNRIVFITGGARSGKSSFALKEASRIQGKRLFIATAEPLDDEMKQRIERHKKERSHEWVTVEESLDIAKVIADSMGKYEVLLLDCLTLWVSKVLLKVRKDAQDRVFDGFIEMLKDLKRSSTSSTLFIVSNEVGMGIVPENRLARIFIDRVGILNQRLARVSDEVYFVISGIPLKIK